MSRLDEMVQKSVAPIGEDLRRWLEPTPNLTLRPLPEIHISYEEHQALKAGFAGCGVHDSASGIEQMPELAHRLNSVLSHEKLKVLQGFAHSTDIALIVRGMPIESELPATPYEAEAGIDQLPVVAGSILSILASLGTHPVAYEGESEDSVFRHVSPKHLRESEKSSYGSRLDLGMHVDNPHLPLTCEPVTTLSACPEYLSLTGLRCELGVPTRIVAVEDVLSILPSFVEQELRRPNFLIKRPESFGKQGNVIEHVPLLYRGKNGRLYCRYNKASVTGTTADADFSLQLFGAAASHPDVVRSILLQAGDILVFKNQQTLHARDGFSPRYNGRDRWMIRVFGVNDTARLIPLAPNNPFIVRA